MNGNWSSGRMQPFGECDCGGVGGSGARCGCGPRGDPPGSGAAQVCTRATRTLTGWASRGPSTNLPFRQTGENSPSRDKLCLGGGPHADGACHCCSCVHRVRIDRGRTRLVRVPAADGQRTSSVTSGGQLAVYRQEVRPFTDKQMRCAVSRFSAAGHCASLGYSAGNLRAGICAWSVLACPLQPCGYGEVMAILDDVLIGGSFPLVGLGIVALAVPYFIPARRPQVAPVLKSGAKLFLEA